MNDIPETHNGIAGAMATFPGRFETIEGVVSTISPQLDHLYIYVNETADDFPDLSSYKNVTVLDGRHYMGNISANGKIFPLKYIHRSLVFTLDDDFLYPNDYVARYVELFNAFKNRCCLTTHGGILPPQVDWYYERTNVFSARSALKHMELVSLAGSGTFAFHQDTLRCTPSDFLPDVMVDLRFSLLAKAQGLPIWCIPRRREWLKPIHNSGLWETYRDSGITHHTHHARRHDWSFDSYREILRNSLVIPKCIHEINLSPEIIHAIVSGRTPQSWQISQTTYQKRMEFMRLLNERD